MTGKNIVLFFEYFNKIHLNKDPFLVPYYLGKMMGLPVKIVYPSRSGDEPLPSHHRGVELIPVSLDMSDESSVSTMYKEAVQYVATHSKDIHVLMLFFGSGLSKLLMKTYRKHNPDGLVYIKLDIDPFAINRRKDMSAWKRWYSWLRYLMWKRPYIWTADVISCETTKAYQFITENLMPAKWCKDVLVYAPNGIDEEEIAELGLHETDISRKENILITIGRLGTYQKNTELLLKALEKTDLQDWKFYFVGSIEDEFHTIIAQYESRHPEWKDHVVWTGPVTNRGALFHLLQRAKVFVLPSRYESYGLVYTEAQRFADYIVSTPVGAIHDVIGNGQYGEIVDAESIDDWATALNNIIIGKTNVNVYDGFDIQSLSWESRLREVVKRLSEKEHDKA